MGRPWLAGFAGLQEHFCLKGFLIEALMERYLFIEASLASPGSEQRWEGYGADTPTPCTPEQGQGSPSYSFAPP